MSNTMNLLLQPKGKVQQTQPDTQPVQPAKEVSQPAIPIQPVTQPVKSVQATQQPVQAQPVQVQEQPAQPTEPQSRKIYTPEEVKEQAEKDVAAMNLQPPGEDKVYKNIYEKLGAVINSYEKPLTAEEKLAEEKKHKRNKMMGSISDGIRAIANLLATTKGAPNGYNPRTSMSEKEQARYDKLRADRKLDEQERLNLLLRQYGLYSNKQQQDAAINSANRREAEDKRKSTYDMYNSYNAINSTLNRTDEANKLDREKLDEDKRYHDGMLGVRKESVDVQRIRANKAGTGKGSVGGKTSDGSYTLTDPDGVVHTYKNKTSWEQGAAKYYPDAVEIANNKTSHTDKTYNSSDTKSTKSTIATEVGKAEKKAAESRTKKTTTSNKNTSKKGAFSSLNIFKK